MVVGARLSIRRKQQHMSVTQLRVVFSICPPHISFEPAIATLPNAAMRKRVPARGEGPTAAKMEGIVDLNLRG